MPTFSCPLFSATDELTALPSQPQGSAFLFFLLLSFCYSTSQGHLALRVAYPHPPLLMVPSKCYQQLASMCPYLCAEDSNEYIKAGSVLRLT